MAKRKSAERLKPAGRVPRFRSEHAERAFWETHDTDHVDWSRAVPAVFPRLKPSTEAISLRLPLGLLAELRVLANKRDVPYQSLLKMFLAEGLSRERAAAQPVVVRERRARYKARSKRAR